MKSRARVLIVDDEALMRRLVRSILIKEGYFVAQASGVEDALAKLKKSHFDIVITDICMPDSDGFDLLTAVKKNHPDTGVIVMTGFGDASTPDQARTLGADEYFTKPFNEREITVIVERVCWRRMVTNRPASTQSRLDISSMMGTNTVLGEPAKS
ncbi:MAG: response regulator [candidate division Zixibacteria bacterium]|nr:response regulator [candidate division Zixibacteria bacterium]